MEDFDSNFTILRGGSEIVNPSEIPEIPADDSKFSTCKHRSEEKEMILPACCPGRAPTKSRGFECLKLAIQNLSEIVCQNCNFYEKTN